MPQFDKLTYEGSRREFLEIAAQLDAPAFIRRAQNTATAYDQLMLQCKKKKIELIEIPSMRLATVGAKVGEQWTSVGRFYVDTSYGEYLHRLYDEWQYELRVHVAATNTASKIRHALVEMQDSFVRFNKNWQTYIDGIDFSTVNKIRNDYNNYYVCEKACAFDSERIAQDGFKELTPVKTADILEQFPMLKIVPFER